MCAIVPGDSLAVDEANKRLIDERRGLQAVPNSFSSHAAPRDSVELLVDERNQSLQGIVVASPPLQEQPGHLRLMLHDAVTGLLRSPFKVSSPFPASRSGRTLPAFPRLEKVKHE